MALVQISYGKLAEKTCASLATHLSPDTFSRTNSDIFEFFLFYNIPLNSSNFPTSKPKIIKKKQVSSTRVVRVAIKHSITDLSVTKCGITPFEGIRERFKCGILDLRNICLCNPESWPLESGI